MGRAASYDRQKVLMAARDLFWARGYHNTSLKDLEHGLDMRPGSIYAAFGSKEALFREALDLYVSTGQADLAMTLSGAASPIAGLAAHVRSLGGILRGKAPSRACMLVKTLLETPDDDPVLRRSVEEVLRRVELIFHDAFRKARDEGEIAADVDPELLAARLQVAIFGLRAYAQRTDAADRVEKLVEDIARGIEALAIRAPSRAALPCAPGPAS
ncbi:TetR/AcrR family transcriptional regulator [Roseicyclus mahoneyensis]|uniref:TetR family transcriptional regulator n=1 Tax=Roseicyclus mahoneyensis TaxID=164332 RepID=A0A316GIM7_9RHOB|nr:TetR/AcrR family transcriptional regulator [Roseicyclus mahoneyensis]PWK60947.1 TetR family transcriptional regulator [Roseicyclus mahoneyensis]